MEVVKGAPCVVPRSRGVVEEAMVEKERLCVGGGRGLERGRSL